MLDASNINAQDQTDIAIANSGDVAGFERIYLRYKNWTFQLAWRLANRDENIAADVCQEVFTWFYTRFPGFSLTSSMKSFLYPAVRNTVIRQQERKRRYSSVDLPLDIPDTSLPIGETPQDEMRRHLASLLDNLSDTQRHILLMRFVDDMTLAEIASAIEISESSVKTTYYRTLKKLKDSPAIKNIRDLKALILLFL